MEKVPGRDLNSTWYSMTIGQRLDLVQRIVMLERAHFDISLPAYGSIYIRGTLPTNARTVDIPLTSTYEDPPGFCIGPSAELL